MADRFRPGDRITWAGPGSEGTLEGTVKALIPAHQHPEEAVPDLRHVDNKRMKLTMRALNWDRLLVAVIRNRGIGVDWYAPRVDRVKRKEVDQ